MFRRKQNQPKPVLPSTSIMNPTSNSPVIEDKYKCKNCLKFFDPTKEEKCYYHSGTAIMTGSRVRNCYDEVKYDCCGKIQLGFNPVLKEATGCKTHDNHELLSN